ncbi:hypothetical protein HHK36_000672 [Tetracentron sinense]|uniref:Endonuclease/exonuclease/phosphatase domain-containing protein n=1 Tax=Tetracentron sinense TaxID=13715 RepID=A0A834ZRZ5_TETSI|nr:hypothetical protein HHK36_000672 [Tetracentron sinense]
MRLVSWNCWGLGNPHAVRDLHQLMKEKDPSIMFLMETKMDSKRMTEIKFRLGFHHALVIPSLGKSRGLTLMWKDTVELIIQNYSQTHIDALIILGQNSEWRLTGFYGNPDSSKRKESWALLKMLGHLCMKPWICMSDLNEILSSNEKQGGKCRNQQKMMEFREAVVACQLVDMGYKRVDFTWNNMRKDEANIQERLDRAMVSTSLLDWFKGSGYIQSCAVYGVLWITDNLEVIKVSHSSTFVLHQLDDRITVKEVDGDHSSDHIPQLPLRLLNPFTLICAAFKATGNSVETYIISFYVAVYVTVAKHIGVAAGVAVIIAVKEVMEEERREKLLASSDCCIIFIPSYRRIRKRKLLMSDGALSSKMDVIVQQIREV